MKIERVKITPSLAEKWLDQVPPFQRKLNMKQVNKLVLAINRGEWRENGDTFVFDDKGLFLNGQHRCKAIVLADKPVWGIVIKNIGGGEETFHTIDDGKPRKVADFLQTKNVHNVAAVARIYWLVENGLFPSSTGGSTIPPTADVLKLIKPHLKYVESLVPLLNDAGRVTGQLSFIAFLVFYYTEIQSQNYQKVADFFASVGDGLELKSENMAYKLRQKFIKLEKGKELKRVQAQALILKALNYYLDNENVERLTWSEDREPFPELKGYLKKQVKEEKKTKKMSLTKKASLENQPETEG